MRKLLMSACALVLLATATPAVADPLLSTAPSTSATPAPAAANVQAVQDDQWTSEAAEKFWTPKRMAAATPDSPRSEAPAGWKPAARLPAAAAAKNGYYFGGVPTVGTFFHYTRNPATDQLEGRFCSASVVDSPQGNVILTAAHCSGGSKGMFVPRYDGLATNPAPYGRFPVQQWIRDSRWYKVGGEPTRDAYSDLDYAFARVGTNSRNQSLQKAVGAALKLGQVNGDYTQTVTVIGYPGSHNPRNRPIICPGVTTRRLPGYRQLRMDCGGFYGGTSGSPWITGLNTRTGSGTVIGDLGGYYGGGLENNSDRISFAVTYDKRALEIYAAAKNNTPPQTYPRGYSMYPTGGGRWTDARKMASGDYNGDGRTDMVVVWGNGEVTLYAGDGNGGFSGESRITKSDTWKDAKVIAGGDFTGSDSADLVVVWTDGEVTLYTGDGRGGFAEETQLQKPNATWRNANQITAGRFSDNQRTDDLMVRWGDGKLSLYTDVDGQDVLHEHRLRDPNDTWKKATLLTAGNFTGGSNWDVMVRWSDGGVSLYRDAGPSSVGTEVRMPPSDRLWTHASVMTAGAYTPGDPDDLLVRWSDGETVLYTDTSTTLGHEHMLVPPKAG
ncbi:FG-GAP-like repeat-containing protein [Streptomyces sp. Ag109_O5-1]|uniref:FG-GAP-like repeat-containing protein n=1 Tax=Streptomyces sp. Ag109_O5-1 TaxID=1938851 RepID=UPI001627BD53|nr:FG-GAP-like repeat-containing protein [Streptomyces sp. Ag109_O5-1]